MRRPSKLPLYVKAYTDRHGKSRYYYRRKGFPQTPLPGMPWTPSFMEAYEAAANAAKPEIGAGKVVPRSMGALTISWLQTAEVRDVKPITRKGILRLVDWLQEQHGHRLVADMQRTHVDKLLAKWADRPSDHNRMLSILRRLLTHAVVLGWIKTSPVVGFRKRKLAGTYATWTEEQIAAFETRWAVGTTERLAFDLLLWTGQRSTDVRTMGRQHIEDGRVVLRQSKTGNRIDIPIAPALGASLALMPADRVLFLVDGNGKPFTTSTFSHFMTTATTAAGVEGVTPHGLRKAACRRLAEQGCSASEIQAISGHRSLREVERYVEAANQKLLAASAMAKVVAMTGDRTGNKSV